MRQLLPSILFAALSSIPLTAGLASTAHAGNCRPAAIERLRAASPDGFAVYEAIKDKKFFMNWISCDDAQLGLPTAVHESVHYITAEIDAFPLVHGGEIKRPHEVSGFFAPSLIAGKFNRESAFVSTYLRRGSASSAGDFLYLLDELNAYTHDLNAAVALNGSRRVDEQVDNRDGLAALMAFVALYVQRAEESEPVTWSGLQKPQVTKTMSELWGRAEAVMASSCRIQNFGTEDKGFIRQVCQAKPQSSLQKIIGQAPVCPSECLKSTRVAEQASEPVDTTPTGTLRTSPSAARPFWSRAANRRLPPSRNIEADED
jgi:hypothetical protein